MARSPVRAAFEQLPPEKARVSYRFASGLFSFMMNFSFADSDGTPETTGL